MPQLFVLTVVRLSAVVSSISRWTCVRGTVVRMVLIPGLYRDEVKR